MAKLSDNTTGALNLIAPKTELVGDITTITDIRIDGILNGNLKTDGRLVVGVEGVIKGEVTCKSAEIEGNLEGEIEVFDLLTLKKTSSLSGTVTTGQLMIEPGAVFSGNCKMGSEAKKSSK